MFMPGACLVHGAPLLPKKHASWGDRLLLCRCPPSSVFLV